MVECYDEKNGKKLSVDLAIPKLRPNAIPSILPECPAYLSTKTNRREDPSEKKARIEFSQVEACIAESLHSQHEYEKKFCFISFESLLDCLQNVTLTDSWSVIQKPECLCFVNIGLDPYPHVISSVTVSEDLQVKVFRKHVELRKLGDSVFPKEVKNVNVLIDLMASLSEAETSADTLQNHLAYVQDSLTIIKENVGESSKEKVQFISEQLSLLTNHKNKNKFNSSFLIFCSLVFSISPHAFRFIRSSGFFTLPHAGTLRRVCSVYNVNPKFERFGNNFLTYVKQKFSYLEACDKHVVLMMDEIHLKSYFDFKGGSILGASFNCEEAASSAYVFMIQSIASSFRDVVHILPVKKIVAECLFEILSKVIQGLENIGLSVICISSDNNAINRRAVSMFSTKRELSIVYPHPIDPTRPLFYIIDSVHNFKSARNNWLNQKNEGKCFIYPSFNSTEQQTLPINIASFETLRKLYNLEFSSLVKYAYTLTEKALFPSSLERQNVRFVLQIFNNALAEGLEIAGSKYPLPHISSTAEFIRIMSRWFEIMNVGQIFKGKHKLNPYQEPLTADESDIKVAFLNNFIDWLKNWENCKPSTGFFTRETLLALKHTSYAVLELTRYCCQELGMKYVLTSKLQTDALEERFGRYRQLAGSQYHISVVQLYESEMKLRLQSFLPLTLNSSRHGKLSVSPIENIAFEDRVSENDSESSLMDKISVMEKDLTSLNDILPCLAYVAGYCAHSVLKKLSCSHCRDNLVIDRDLEVDEALVLIKSLDRGGLKYPSNVTLTVICHSYIIISKLLSREHEGEFLKLPNQRTAACNVIFEVLSDKEEFAIDYDCPNGHEPEGTCKMIIWASCNIFLKNYCKKVNNSLMSKKTSERKLKTLQS